MNGRKKKEERSKKMNDDRRSLSYRTTVVTPLKDRETPQKYSIEYAETKRLQIHHERICGRTDFLL
eukprot:scaffold3655_cov260-Chaetoceros_neogracile.AAC.4